MEDTKKKSRERYCLEKLREEGVREEFNERITQEYERRSIEQETVEESWETFREEVDRVASEIMGKRKSEEEERRGRYGGMSRLGMP